MIRPDQSVVFQKALQAWGEHEKRELYEASLADFLIGAWPIIDPGQKLTWGMAMDAIADHLQAVDSGHIRRLLITVPPGFSKSSFSNVCFPVWSWLRRPYLRFICASYSEGLTQRDNDRCRRIIGSEWFKENWGDRFSLVPPNKADWFGNDKTGWKLATSVGGQLMGWRADCVILDDPNKPAGEDSKVRDSTNIWFREVVPTRLNDPDLSSIIVIQQRLHLEDIVGTALSSTVTEWTHLNIPMEYEPRQYVNGYRFESDQVETFFDDEVADCEQIFWRDWRETEGELAWPERFPLKTVQRLKEVLGPTMVAAQLQQHPVPRGGAIIKSDWWQMWPLDQPRPPFDFLLASLDTAYTEKKTNDPSAMTIWGVNRDEFGNPRLFLLWAWQDWMDFHTLVEFVVAVCQIGDRVTPHPKFPVHMVLIESAANGISVAQEMERLLRLKATFGTDLINPQNYGRDKVARLRSIEHIFANGMVWTSDRDWATKVIWQCASVPYTKDDHLADTTAQAVRWLRDRGYAPVREETREDWVAERAYKQPMRPLYPI